MAVDQAAFQFLAEHSTDIVCRIAEDQTFHYVSPSSARILGWSPEEMTGKLAHEFLFPREAPLFAKSLQSPSSESPITVRMRKKDGSLAWVEIRHSTPDASSPERVLVIHDISERKTLEERLSLLELTDSRTGLSTQRAFEDALEREWHRCLRDQSSLSLLIVDFNHFRQFHEQHREGDRCLSEAAAAVISAIRVTDFAALYGSEDIAIILPSTEASGAIKVAEKIQAALQALRPSGILARDRHIHVSIGMATVSARSGGNPHMPELLRMGALQALEKAKRTGAPAHRFSGTSDTP
jgi:diguanylate cyclase (GGDEF)-like protein/PAS domain S-box-containing protein